MKLPILFVAQPPREYCRRDSAQISLSQPHRTDICAAITYYLWSRAEVDAYLEERRQQEAAVRWGNEVRFPPAGVRERLLARRAR